MAFHSTGLRDAFEGQGDAGFVVYSYGTFDPLEQVVAPGYFNSCRRLAVGDLIFVGTRPRPVSSAWMAAQKQTPIRRALLMVAERDAWAQIKVRLVQDFGGPNDGNASIGGSGPNDGNASIGRGGPNDGNASIGRGGPNDGNASIGRGGPSDGDASIGGGGPNDGDASIGGGGPSDGDGPMVGCVPANAGDAPMVGKASMVGDASPVHVKRGRGRPRKDVA